MINTARIALFAAALSVATIIGGPSFAQINAEKAKVAPDEKSAIALAEKAALPLIGGADKLALARPFKATGHGDIWLIISQPVPDPMKPAAAKRSVVVQLSAETGEIFTVDTAD
jgi:hypothetical protein